MGITRIQSVEINDPTEAPEQTEYYYVTVRGCGGDMAGEFSTSKAAFAQREEFPKAEIYACWEGEENAS